MYKDNITNIVHFCIMQMDKRLRKGCLFRFPRKQLKFQKLLKTTTLLLLNLLVQRWYLTPRQHFGLPLITTSSILFKQPVINNYLLRQRSTEELQILRQDMHNTLLYFEKKLKCIKDKLDVLKVGISTPFTRGAIALLYRLQNKTSNRLQHAINLFGKLIDVTCFEQPPSYVNEDLEKPEWSGLVWLCLYFSRCTLPRPPGLVSYPCVSLAMLIAGCVLAPRSVLGYSYTVSFALLRESVTICCYLYVYSRIVFCVGLTNDQCLTHTITQ